MKTRLISASLCFAVNVLSFSSLAKAANEAWKDASGLLPLLIDLFSFSKDK